MMNTGSGKSVRSNPVDVPRAGEEEGSRTMPVTDIRRSRSSRRPLLIAVVAAVFAVTSFASARIAAVFEGEGGWSVFAGGGEVAQQAALQPFANYVSLECLLSYIDHEYPEVLACIGAEDRGEMLQFVVLRPNSMGEGSGVGAGSRMAPDDLGDYQRSSDATENLDGVSYFFEQ